MEGQPERGRSKRSALPCGWCLRVVDGPLLRAGPDLKGRLRLRRCGVRCVRYCLLSWLFSFRLTFVAPSARGAVLRIFYNLDIQFAMTFWYATVAAHATHKNAPANSVASMTIIAIP